MHRAPCVTLIVLIIAVLFPTAIGIPQPAQAQQAYRCFDETGFCIDGRIAEFWQQNGALPVFGLPITPQQRTLVEGQMRQVQWFERARLELHPHNAPPYDVQLGRLGIDRLTQQGRDWQTFSPETPEAAQDDCQFFAETGYSVCGDILQTWQVNGLEIDGQPGTSRAESLALFGLPISPAQPETLDDGREYVVQWFERARFELHPENAPPAHVLLGLLGSEVFAAVPPDSSLAPPLMACVDQFAAQSAAIPPAQAARAALPGVSTPQQQDSADIVCPEGVTCSFIPAYYGLNDPADPYNYGNYSYANRPLDGLDIRYVVIHNTEEPFARTLEIFQDPAKYVSVHYVINNDGSIVQMVRNQDIAWHGGNDYIYAHAIGIEHVGYAIDGATWYTDAMYQASARLVQHLASQYDIPLDRGHIIGHDEIPGRLPEHQALMHWDPGPFWDWGRYMALMQAPLEQADAPPDSTIVTIQPDFATNTPPLTYCYPGSGCGAVPPQGANFVYLHTAPDSSAPLVSNPYLNSTPTDASNWANKALAGQQFYRIDRQGDWDALFFGGQRAWLYNPGQINTTPGTGTLVTPAAGRGAIPAYGYPFPEAEAYPPGSENLPPYGYRYGSGYVHTPATAPVPIYEIPAGQVYVATDRVQSQYVSTPYAPTRDTAATTIVNGQQEYYQVFFHHRFVYVRADDVDVLDCTAS